MARNKRRPMTLADFAPGDRIMVSSERGLSQANMVGVVTEPFEDPYNFRAELVAVNLAPNALGQIGGEFWIEPDKLVKLPANEEYQP